MKTGLYFGSFNPVHVGHLMIANYMIEFTDLEEVWFVISPQNPLKRRESLLQDYHRFEMVQQAIGDNQKLRASDIEFRLPKPSFTIDTLTYLSEKHPRNKFVLIMGEDNLQSITKWKNYRELLDRYEMYVYPRAGNKEVGKDPVIRFEKARITMVNAPKVEISSSFIRESIRKKRDIRYFLPGEVWEYIDKMNFYSQDIPE